MSLLRAHGHIDPERYPLGYLIDEANFVEERENTRLLTEMDLLRQHVGAILSKETARNLRNVRDQINVVSRARRDLIPGGSAPEGEGDEDLPRDDDPPGFDGA